MIRIPDSRVRTPSLFGMWCRVTRRLLAAALLLSMATAGTARAEAPGEYQVKAAFLYNFAKFVEWPADASDTPGHLVLCIMGTPPFGHALESIRGKRAHGRTVEVRQMGRTEDPGRCNLLFIGASEEARLPYILDALAGRSILTVSDMDRFTVNGGMIGMSVQDEAVTFDVNLRAAQQARLRISPQLLRLARDVIPGRKP